MIPRRGSRAAARGRRVRRRGSRSLPADRPDLDTRRDHGLASDEIAAQELLRRFRAADEARVGKEALIKQRDAEVADLSKPTAS